MSDHPAESSPSSPSTAAARGATRRSRDDELLTRRRGTRPILLVLLLLIAAGFAVLLLSPDVVRIALSRLLGTAPSATIAVAPPPSQPSFQAAPPRTSDPGAAALAAGELSLLRATVADLNGRLTGLESRSAAVDDARGQLATRLSALDARLAALIEQPGVTPSMLTDALNEQRRAARTEIEQAAEQAAHGATRRAVEATVENAVRETVQKSQVETAATLGEIERRLRAAESAAPASGALADIEKRLVALEKMASAVAAVVDLERRTGALEKAAAAMIAVPDIERRLAAIEKATGPLASQSRLALQGESMALGLLALRVSLDRGGAYGDVLSALRVAASGDDVLNAEVGRLAANALDGVPTIAALRLRLQAMLRAADESTARTAAPAARAAPDGVASEAGGAERGFWAEIGRRLSSMVTVHRLEDSAPDDNAVPAATGDSLLTRAAARLASDDLSGALVVLDNAAARRGLSTTQLAALDEWLRDARARLQAEAAFATLSRRALALYAGRSTALAPGENDARLQP